MGRLPLALLAVLRLLCALLPVLALALLPVRLRIPLGLTVSLLRHLPSLLPVALPLLLHVTDRLLMLAVAPGRGLLLLHVILGLLGGGCRNCGGVNGLLHLHL